MKSFLPPRVAPPLGRRHSIDSRNIFLMLRTKLKNENCLRNEKCFLENKRFFAVRCEARASVESWKLLSWWELCRDYVDNWIGLHVEDCGEEKRENDNICDPAQSSFNLKEFFSVTRLNEDNLLAIETIYASLIRCRCAQQFNSLSFNLRKPRRRS